MVGCQSGFFIVRVIAHGGCTNTVREFALTVDSGRENLCRSGESEMREYRAWLFSRRVWGLNDIPARKNRIAYISILEKGFLHFPENSCKQQLSRFTRQRLCRMPAQFAFRNSLKDRTG